MIKQSFKFPSEYKNAAIHAYAYIPEKKPTAILQIVHGMKEYFQRYERLALFLCDHGILVCGHDHLGHNGSLIEDTLGYFGEEKQEQNLIHDVGRLQKIMQNRYIGVPYFIMGHSMGSFITRLYLSTKPKINGAIICGTGQLNKAVQYFGLPYSRYMWQKRGSKYIDPNLNKIFDTALSAKFKGETSKNSWISRDVREVNMYDKDPKIKFDFTVSAYNTLFNLTKHCSDDRWAYSLNKETPIFIISGSMDPVGDFGKAPIDVYTKLLAAKQEEVSIKLYTDARHELVNESCRDEVFSDILNWILEHLSQYTIGEGHF